MRWPSGQPARTPNFIDLPQLPASPRRPRNGFSRLFAKLSDGSLHKLEPDGTETDLAAAGGGTSELLGQNNYAVATTYSTSSTSLADVDATNMAVTFTAPASGNVIVVLSAFGDIAGGSHRMQWGIRESTTNVKSVGAMRDPLGGAFLSVRMLITGISAGSHTYKWSFAVNNVAATGRILVGDGSDLASSALMEVWAAL